MIYSQLLISVLQWLYSLDILWFWSLSMFSHGTILSKGLCSPRDFLEIGKCHHIFQHIFHHIQNWMVLLLSQNLMLKFSVWSNIELEMLQHWVRNIENVYRPSSTGLGDWRNVRKKRGCPEQWIQPACIFISLFLGLTMDLHSISSLLVVFIQLLKDINSFISFWDISLATLLKFEFADFTIFIW